MKRSTKILGMTILSATTLFIYITQRKQSKTSIEKHVKELPYEIIDIIMEYSEIETHKKILNFLPKTDYYNKHRRLVENINDEIYYNILNETKIAELNCKDNSTCYKLKFMNKLEKLKLNNNFNQSQLDLLKLPLSLKELDISAAMEEAMTTDLINLFQKNKECKIANLRIARKKITAKLIKAIEKYPLEKLSMIRCVITTQAAARLSKIRGLKEIEIQRSDNAQAIARIIAINTENDELTIKYDHTGAHMARIIKEQKQEQDQVNCEWHHMGF